MYTGSDVFFYHRFPSFSPISTAHIPISHQRSAYYIIYCYNVILHDDDLKNFKKKKKNRGGRPFDKTVHYNITIIEWLFHYIVIYMPINILKRRDDGRKKKQHRF